ncbi:MAG TPA: CDP-glycerol glycerophosphotransferase family protein [Propionicimonas sp.]|nr:CDP-glycerol glycerophosphotransferase family protein [Propionicimonas sp.]
MPFPLFSGLSSLRTIGRAVGGYSLVCDVLGLAAVIAALVAPGSVWVHILLWLVALLVVAPSLRTVVLEARGEGSAPLAMGTATMARVLVTLAGLAILVQLPEPGLGVVASILLCLLVVGEQAMRRAVRSAVPQAANIPGWDVLLPSVALANWLFAANTAGLVLVAAVATLGLTAWLPLLAAVAGIVLAGMIAGQVIRYLSGRNRFEANLPTILKKLGPVFAFHWQAPVGTAYQATMWLPYLARLGVPYFILVRTIANFEEVSRLTDAPVILRIGLEDLDPIVCPSLKAVFYANTAVRNSHMIRFPALTHIQLNHGDSDKIASVSPTFRQYDKNFVAGQAAIDRFAKHGVATRADQFVIVGRPQLEHVERVVPGQPLPAAPTVLYSPTWSGFYEDSDYSSLVAGPDIVEALLRRGCTVIFRPHPYARRHKGNSDACDRIIALLTEDAAQTGRAHVHGVAAETDWSVVDCFNACDAMVSDVSSLVSDFLISGKPFAMGAVSAHGPAFVEEFPQAEAAYVIEIENGSPVGIDEVLTDLLGADPKAATRESLRTYYLSDTPPEQCVERFVSQARAFLV